MPNTSQITPTVVSCFGGLVLNKDVFTMHPGEALQLQNFEPSIKGGYRRLSGTSKWNSNQVNGSEKILGLQIFNNGVVAAAGNVVTFATSGSTYSTIGTRTSAGRYKFDVYNFNNTDKLI